jgi:4-amino-4-deoxy-L-arabinose transferase-like glycosyltransferase
LGYMLYSAIAYLDIPLTAFMALSVLSFLAWIKLGNYRYLLFSGLSLGLASLTKYTATPILLGTFIIWLIFMRKKISRSTLFKLAAVIAVSLVPLALWAYGLSISYGNFVYRYSETYGLFPHDASLLAINLLIYIVGVLLLWGIPFLSWIKKRPFDSDIKLLFIYLTVLFVFFVLITPMKATMCLLQIRYLLPIVPVTTIISAKSLIQEKPIKRFIILSIQFIVVTLFSLLMLLYPPFFSFTSDFYSNLLRILGISGISSN